MSDNVCPWFIQGICQSGWNDEKTSVDEAEDSSWILWSCDCCGTEWKEVLE